jgi:hypothetical protein
VKLAKFLLNLFYSVFVFAIILVLSAATFAGVVYQTTDTTAKISMRETDTNVTFYDPLLYWKDDLSNDLPDTSLKNTKLRVSNWFGWAWWKKAGGAVDQYFVDPTTKLFKGIFLPLTEANNIMQYHDADMSDFVYTLDEDDGSSDKGFTIKKFEYASESYFGVDLTADTKADLAVELAQVCQDDPDAYNIEKLMTDNWNQKAEMAESNGVLDIYEFADAYPLFYKTIYSLYKYNAKSYYNKWYNKYVYVVLDDSGKYKITQNDVDLGKASAEDIGRTCSRHLKASVYCTNVMWFLTIILTIFFVWENPIEVKRNDAGHTEVGPMFARHFKPRHHKEDEDDDKEESK